MKIKFFFLFSFFILSFGSVSILQAQENQNRYVQDNTTRARLNSGKNIVEIVTPAYPEKEVSQEDPHVKIVKWDPNVPLPRILDSIKEGASTQMDILKLFSAPNVMLRTAEDKETWVYRWMWSYKNEEDPNATLIQMAHAGKKVRHNSRPVSMIVTFNDKRIVESYVVRLIKTKKDLFDED